ncbi:flavodoxin domain-containing protein [Streptomyces sp. NPDC002004]
MTRKILVAYASKYGSTAEIARSIGEVLGRTGVVADVLPAGGVPDVAPYDGVVLGGAVYAGRWHKDARHFVHRNRRTLVHRPVWLFGSGPLDVSALEERPPVPPGIRRVANRLDARDCITFGGRLTPDADGLVARLIADSGNAGDFRDFTRIESWAERIAEELAAEPERRQDHVRRNP